MEIGRDFLESISKLVKEKQPAVKVIHLSRYAEANIREYLNIMYGTSYRKEGENRNCTSSEHLRQRGELTKVWFPSM